MKQLLFFLLMNLSFCVLGQDFTFLPGIRVNDTFLIKLEANYGDTISLFFYDRIITAYVRKEIVKNEIARHDFCIKDTISFVKQGTYLFYYIKNQKTVGGTKMIRTYGYPRVDSTIHYRILVHINPESIPTETFLLYPNPVTNGSLSLVYKAEWEQSEMTISNAMGQIVQTIAAQDGNCGDAHSLLVEGLASGLYYIRLRKDGKTITKPFWVR